MNYPEIVDAFLKLVSAVGWDKALISIVFAYLLYWNNRILNGRLEDKQHQIDELAKENRDYRDRFMALLDHNFGFHPPNPARLPSPPSEPPDALNGPPDSPQKGQE